MYLISPPPGSRINVIYNFGYVALNIMQLREEDSGTYTVRAINKAGECSCQASLKVICEYPALVSQGSESMFHCPLEIHNSWYACAADADLQEI